MFKQQVPWRRPQRHRNGFSLLEMLISLAIFGIIVVPFVSLPIKAMQKNDSLLDQATSIQEVHHIFIDNLKKELGQAKHFFPLEFPDTQSENALFDAKKQLFIAYYNPKQRQTSQIGYMLAPNTEDSTKYELFRTEIPNTAESNMDAYQSLDPNLTLWQRAGLSSQKDSILLETEQENSRIYFQYCTGSICNDNILPKQANSVRIMASTEGENQPSAIYITLNQSKIKIPALYFRLGSDLNAQTASLGPYAFPVALNSQSSENSNLRDTNATGSGRRMTTPDETGSAITLGDPTYNPKTGTALLVGQGDSNGNASKRTFYILKWQPKTTAYPGYESTSSSSIVTTNAAQQAAFSENSPSNPFPITLNANSPGYPGSDFNFVSVTQDDTGYIYVLATRPESGTTPFEARLLRFSPQGGYMSQSNISGIGDSAITNAFGIAYTSSNPQEIHVLVSLAGEEGTNYVIRTYNKFDNHSDANFVSHTAQSPLLNDSRISSTFFTNSVPTGLEIVPGKNQYIISGIMNTEGQGATCQFVSFPIGTPDATTDANFGKPIDRGFLLSTVKQVSSGSINNLSQCHGIALDPSADMLISPYSNNNDESIAYIGLNTSIQRNY